MGIIVISHKGVERIECVLDVMIRIVPGLQLVSVACRLALLLKYGGKR